MAKQTTMDKVKGKIFETRDGKILFVYDVAGLGYQYTLVKATILPNGEISKVEWETASHVNVAKHIEPVVLALYSKVKTPIADAVNCPVLVSYRPYIQSDLSELGYEGKIPFDVASYKDVDKNGVTLEQYVLNLCGYPDPNTGDITTGIKLEDKDVFSASVAGTFKDYDISGHNPFSNLDPNDVAGLTAHVPTILKDSVLKSKLYASIESYFKYVDEALNQKGLLIYGVPGTGKTTAVQVFAMVHNLPYAAITGNPALTEEDLFGYVIPNDDPNKPQHWITAWTDILKVAQAGGVVVFDEANNFSPAVQIGLNNVVYGENRFIKFQDKVYNVHPKTIFVVTTNFGEQGNNPMNGAFKQRFYPILATEFNAEQYAEYLSKLYPAIEAKALVEYTKFMYQAIDYTRKTFDNLDRYSPDTPALYTRAISQILTMTFTKKSLKQALGDFVFAITHGVEDNKTKTQGFLAQFDKEISSIEQMFFMNKQIINDAKKTLKSLLSIGVAASTVNTNTSSTNADDIFDKANNMDSSSANSIIDGLNNINW